MSIGLYRTFKSNYVPYFPDGMGRDRYIAYNNAGFFKYFPNTPKNDFNNRTGCFFGTKIITHTKSPSIKAPNFHYYADGNGRDQYILVNGGGLFNQTKPLISYKLTDFLRKDNSIISPVKKVKVFLSRDEIKYNKILKERERNIIKRLYSNERKKFIKRPAINFKSFFSVEQLNNDSRENLINNTKSFLFAKNKTQNNSKEKDNKLHNLTERNNDNGNKLFKKPIRIIPKKNEIIKIKPKIIIDAKINNKIGRDAKEIIYPESKEQEEIIYRNNDNNVIANMEKLKDYQFRKRIFKNRTFQSPHPINSFSTGKDYKIKIEN